MPSDCEINWREHRPSIKGRNIFRMTLDSSFKHHTGSMRLLLIALVRIRFYLLLFRRRSKRPWISSVPSCLTDKSDYFISIYAISIFNSPLRRCNDFFLEKQVWSIFPKIFQTCLAASSALPKGKRDVLHAINSHTSGSHQYENAVKDSRTVGLSSYNVPEVPQDTYGPPGYQPGAPLSAKQYLQPAVQVTKYSTSVSSYGTPDTVHVTHTTIHILYRVEYWKIAVEGSLL